MAYAGNQTAIVTFKYLVAGGLAYSVVEYGTEDAGLYATPSNIANEVDTVIVPEILDIMSDEATLVDFKVETTHPPSVPLYAPHIEIKNAPGNVVSEMLPPYASYRIYKTPDNSAVEGSLSSPFRLGMIRFPGVPESFQVNGIVTALGVAALNQLALVAGTLTAVPAVPGGTLDYRMLMVRRETGTTNFGLAPVSSLNESSILGTQNSRKIT